MVRRSVPRSSVVVRPTNLGRSDASGARLASFPGFVEPCLATLWPEPPSGSKWVHEVKFDGYRAQVHLRRREGPRVYTRSGYDWTSRFAPLAAAIAQLPADELVLDGEAVVPDARGVPDFALLHADLAAGRTDRLQYFAFDLLYQDGFDLRPAALIVRKRRLAELLAGFRGPILYSEHFEEDGPRFYARACEMKLEGVVSKDRDAPYRSGRSDAWIKTKCTKRDSFPIVAFVEKLGANPRRIASLYVGRRDGGKVLYAGKARSGYTDAVARDLRERLDPLIRKTSPLTLPVKKPKATWVEPVVDAEIAYSTVTEDGLLREAVFKGVREDLTPERDHAPTRTIGKPHIGVPRENILQLLPDAVVPSKDELAAYWKRVGKKALAHLGGRPLKLVRHTHGTTFYHKGTLPPIPSAVHQLKIEKREGGEGTRLWIDDLAGLLGLVEIGAVELHPWNATVDDIEKADRLVVDLDPGDGVEWRQVIDAALALRAILEDHGLDSWPKVTGGKGLHVMVPLASKPTHDRAREQAKILAQQLVATAPDRYTLSSDPRKRTGRIFLDYLRNGRGNTAIGAWSPRARPRFPIAAPVTWKEVESGIRADAFTLSRPRTRTR
jgi:bifunctional non-homologous end joining protein LigD